METYHTPWNWGGSEREFHACVHEGQIVVFLMDGSAFKRAADGSWSLYELADRLQSEAYWGSYALGSVIIG